MNVVDLNQRVRELQQQNQRLRNTVNSNRNSQSQRGNTIDFQTKYRKALKQIYQVIQANKQLKEELDKLKTSRNKLDGNMADVRKQEIYKVYQSVLNQKNQLKEHTENLQRQRERAHTQLQALQAEVNVLKGEKLYLAQQKEAAQAKASHPESGSKAEQLHQLQLKFRQKQQQFHRTLQNYEQHHITLSNQNKKNQERLAELQQKLTQNEKNWRNRFETKDIEFKEIRTNVRHEYQDQINMLRKQINSLKLLNTQLMTKLQTIQMDGRKDQQMTEYEIQMLSSIKELRLQMQPLKKQIIELQQQNSFQKQQAQRERTQLQLKLYEYESNIQHYSIVSKNQEDKVIKLNETIKKHSDNQVIVKKLEEENRILGGRVIVLESKDVTLQNRRESGGSRKLQENILEFQTRVEMLLSEKQNIANIKNISIHQLVTLKAYIVQMDQKLKNAYNQNEYAAKKYKSYKQKYLNSVKQIRNHELLQNTLKSKIMGYDKLVQRLQSQLQKNVNISQMQIIDMNSKSTHEQVQIQTFRKKYQSLKQKLILQQKYNKQQLQTVKLNFQTKIVDLSIKAQQINALRQSVLLYKEKNQELLNHLAQKENQILQVRLSVGKQTNIKNDNQFTLQSQNRQLISSLQQTIHKQQAHILKLQTQARTQEDSNRKRIITLERQLHDINSQFNKVKLSSSTKYSSQKSSQEISSQNKRLKNKISELQNQIILIKGRSAQQTSKNSYELEFRISNLQIEKNELANRLQTQISYKKRLEKQNNETSAKNNQLDAQLTQVNMQNNRKIQEIKYELNQKQSIIQNLQDQIKRLKAQQRTNLQSSSLLNNSIVQPKQDHSICENKIKRLERELQNVQSDNEQLRKKVNQGSYSSTSFNYELQSLKHEKQESRLKVQRFEKQVVGLRSTLAAMQEQKYELNRGINSMKSQISSFRLSHQDELFQKDRIIAQLRSKVEHTQSASQNYISIQGQLQQALSQKERQLASVKSKLYATESDLQKMNDTINKYNKQINAIKFANQSSHSTYTQQMQQLLQQKSRTLKKYEQQMNNLHYEIQAKNEQIALKSQSLMRVQRQLGEFKQFEQQIDRLKSSLIDRESLISKNRFQMASYQEQTDRAKKQVSNLKQQIQRVRMEVLHKDDQISSLRMEISTLGSRVSNQVKSDFMEQLSQKQTQLSRLSFQIQSLQTNYNNIQQQLNQTQSRQRRSQQQLIYVKNQLSRAEEQFNQVNEKLMKRQSQLSQINGEMSGLKFLEQQVNEKNLTINKLRAQISSIRIQINHLTQEVEYKESTIVRQNNQLKLVRQQVMERQQNAQRKDMELRNVMIQVQRIRSAFEENQITMQQKDFTINKLTTDLNKARQQYRDIQEEIQQREQQWSSIQFELNQAKSQINLISDQLQGKDITIAKLSNQAAFLKQQITRLNEQLVEKSHEVNRVSQQVFVQKMEYTNKTSEQVQTLSNEIFGLKRQVQSSKHTIEDLQSQNRRLKIELQGSRIKLTQQNNFYIYSEEDLNQLKEQNNKKYRQIMQLQFELNQHLSQNEIISQRAQQMQFELVNKDEQIQLLNQKIQKLQVLLSQVEEENQYNSQHLQHQVQQFIQTQRQLRYQIQELQSVNYNQSVNHTQTSNAQTQNTEELKFGLKLYTEQTDRMKQIIDQLTGQVNALRLKLTAFTNQQDRIQQNLVTMVMSFAEVEALRQRMKNKQQQINEVRRSFIQAISSSDINSQGGFKSSKLVNLASNNNNEQKIQTFEDVMSQNSASMINYKSQKGGNQGVNLQHHSNVVNEIHEYEVRSDNGAKQHVSFNHQLVNEHIETHSLDQQGNHQQHVQHYNQQVQNYEQQQRQQYFQSGGQQNNQQINEAQYQYQQEQFRQQQQLRHQLVEPNIQLPQPQIHQDIQRHSTSHNIQELNHLRQSHHQEIIATSQVNQVTFQSPNQQINTNITQITQQVTVPPTQITTSQQRGRSVNITYQANSQVQMGTSVDRNQTQRISSSQFQSPSGTTYVRYTAGQQQPRVSLPVQVSAPGVYIPQGMNIQPVRQPMSLSQPMSVSQSVNQSGNRIIVGNQIVPGQVGVSYPPQNLRY